MGVTDLFEKIKKEIKAILGEEAKDKFFQHENTFPDEASAVQAFAESRQKLFNVEDWSHMTGITSTFELYDAQGQRDPNKKPDLGDYIKIILPATTIENWVKVIEVVEEENLAKFVVQPSHNPLTPAEEPGKIEHFFTEEATSTFLVARQGTTLLACEIGKNEVANNQGEEAGDRPILNTVISTGGWAGFQAIQWGNLTKFLVHLKD
ncbi:hypothetical protein TH61_12435 [Rufibacter sp. DG15C]|uniref:hypothetical protein n=1 Tax=Rufibacter sp. DG15C TaxID=1379909 RepID=UPI00078E4891|nr:hypothetical protein [Rufibacter sp. DG15C]AMM51824.1 hypothetical protein TH61_12435 [Rufibacter sp. DG15C]